MSVTVEKKDNNMAVLTIEVDAAKFIEAVEQAYQKQKNRITLPGFRKGRAPRRMIQKMYGNQIFFEEAANLILQTTYEDAVKESGEQVMSRPRIDITQIEEGKPFIYTATVALKPEVTLGQYRGVEIPKKEITVTDEEIMLTWMTAVYRTVTASAWILTAAWTERALREARPLTLT